MVSISNELLGDGDGEEDRPLNKTICESNGYPVVIKRDPFSKLFESMKTPDSLLCSKKN